MVENRLSAYSLRARLVWVGISLTAVVAPARADSSQGISFDLFLVAYRKLPEFEGRSKISTWLVGIAYRVASDRRQLAHVRREVGGGPALLTQRDDRPGPEEMAEQHERAALLDELLAQLRPDQREVFVMFELEELAGKEIATIVDAPLKTVFSRLRLAREAFAAAMARRRLADPSMIRSHSTTTDLARRGQIP